MFAHRKPIEILNKNVNCFKFFICGQKFLMFISSPARVIEVKYVKQCGSGRFHLGKICVHRNFSRCLVNKQGN